MPRSGKKGPYCPITEAQLAKVGSKPFLTRCRSAMILPEFVDKTFGIHNGKEYVMVHIIPEMVGHKLGEFAITRKKGAPPADRKSDKRG